MNARRTKPQMEAVRAALYAIVESYLPCSVRQVYYIGCGRLWEKDSGGSLTSRNPPEQRPRA